MSALGTLTRRFAAVTTGAAVLAAAVITATPAVAATGNGGQAVGWQPDANSLGNLYFYDALGHQITSGNVNDVPMALYYVASGTGAKSGQVRTTTPTLANSGTWAGTQSITSTQTFPAANLPGDLAGFTGPVIKDDSALSFGDNQITAFPNNLTAAGYKDLYEVRMYTDNASAVNKWFAGDIYVNPTTGAWNQVWPVQTTPVVTLTTTAANPAPSGSAVDLTATLNQGAAGTVRFFDGTRQVGATQSVTSTTTTASTIDTPADGRHTYAARFTPTPGTTALGAASSTLTQDVGQPVRYVGLSPSRLLDTRSGIGATGPVAAGGTVALQVLGRGGVPSSGVSAVVLNVTVTEPTASGYITAFPDGTPRPTASNLNFTKGQTIPNLVIVPVGTDGKVSLYNFGGSTQLLADVAGYYTAGAPSSAGSFGALSPSRLLDTRSGIGATGPVAAGGTVALQVLGRGGVPSSGVSAVVLNVTVTEPTASGYITAFPDGTPRPTASNLNFTQGQTIPNLVIVPVGTDGKVSLYNFGGSTQLLADVAGYYTAGAPSSAGSFGALSPSRLLDTRSGIGATGPVAAGGTVALQVLGRGGVPSSGVSAVVLNVTVTEPTASGYITAFPDGTPRPTASNLNFTQGQTIPNLVIVPVGTDGKVSLYNFGGSTQLLADVAGYYRS